MKKVIQIIIIISVLIGAIYYLSPEKNNVFFYIILVVCTERLYSLIKWVYTKYTFFLYNKRKKGVFLWNI